MLCIGRKLGFVKSPAGIHGNLREANHRKCSSGNTAVLMSRSKGVAMKFKTLATILATGGIFFSAGASAIPLPCSLYPTVGLFAAAGSCIDNLDADLLLTYLGDNLPATGFDVLEIQGATSDFYEVGLTWPVGYNPGTLPGGSANPGVFKYAITVLNGEAINAANFDTVVQNPFSTQATGGFLATKQLFDPGSALPFLTLISVNGTRDPLLGETGFNARNTIIVVDTYGPGDGIYTSSSNSFSVSVPEPGTLALLGLGLLGVALGRKRSS